MCNMAKTWAKTWYNMVYGHESHIGNPFFHVFFLILQWIDDSGALASQDDRKTWTPSTVRPASAAVPSSK